MRFVPACAASLVLAATAVYAQSANYSGYAYTDCGPADGAAVRLVLVQGVVPAGVPDRLPRPSIDVLVNGALDAVAGHPITIGPENTPGVAAVARSCPVVGRCAVADSGTLSLTRGADGALTGEFKAQWGTTPERQGKFDVEWRDHSPLCGT